jgi:hypothetical protein
MIRKFVFYVLLIVFTSSCGSGDATDNNEKIVTGFHYSFEELGSKIIDYSGNDYHGEAISIQRVPGKIGNAIEFQQGGASIELKELQDYNPFSDGLTFRVWLKLDYFLSQQQLIGSTTTTTTSSNPEPVINGFAIALINDRLVFQVPSQLNHSEFSITEQLSLPSGTWFHVAITYDWSNISFFYNGNLVATDRLEAIPSTNFTNRIGYNKVLKGEANFGDDQFYGAMDELYIENKILTTQEVMNYYLDTM